MIHFPFFLPLPFEEQLYLCRGALQFQQMLMLLGYATGCAKFSLLDNSEKSPIAITQNVSLAVSLLDAMLCLKRT